jgi:subtilisin family serine protease
VHDLGITGEGVIIGILDTGFHRTHEAFHEPGHELNVLGEYDFINDDGNTDHEDGDPPGQNSHGSLILGTIAAYKPEALIGGAYDASFYLAKTEDISDEQPIEEDYYVSGLEWIEANGGDVATSSLSYSDWYTQEDFDGVTATTTIAVNIATQNGVACCTAASNSGHDQDPSTSHLGAPADAFEVLTCGAVSVEGGIAGFSSDGPTADGRTKPEVCAQGVRTATIDVGDDSGYRTASGTSLSTPLVAAATALVIQAHPDWSVRQIRSAFMQNASWYVENGEYDPLYVYGYGIIDTLAAVEMDFTGDVDRDGDVDLDDLERLYDCLTGPGLAPSEECTGADIDGDEDVDLSDYATYQPHYTGPWEG